MDREYNCSTSSSGNGDSISYGSSETVVPRLSVNDILLASDHPFQSILRISRGAGYAQFGGMPVIIESSYHISKEEYERRRALAWPDTPGSFLPSQDQADLSVPQQPVVPEIFAGWSEEIIDGAESVDRSAGKDVSGRCGEHGAGIESMFSDFRESLKGSMSGVDSQDGGRKRSERRKKP